MERSHATLTKLRLPREETRDSATGSHMTRAGRGTSFPAPAPVKLRSAGLKEAALIYIRTNDRDRCLELLHALVRNKVDLLPEDKRVVVEYANSRNRQDFLPHGYAL